MLSRLLFFVTFSALIVRADGSGTPHPGSHTNPNMSRRANKNPKPGEEVDVGRTGRGKSSVQDVSARTKYPLYGMGLPLEYFEQEPPDKDVKPKRNRRKSGTKEVEEVSIRKKYPLTGWGVPLEYYKYDEEEGKKTPIRPPHVSTGLFGVMSAPEDADL